MRILILILGLKALSAINLRNTGEGVVNNTLPVSSLFLLLVNTKAPRGTKSFASVFFVTKFFFCDKVLKFVCEVYNEALLLLNI